MNGFARFLSRVPRPALFAIAAVIQLALIAAMVIDRASVLREGKEIALQTRPVDPRDFLRGDYVVLSYDISAIPAGELRKHETKDRAPVRFLRRGVSAFRTRSDQRQRSADPG